MALTIDADVEAFETIVRALARLSSDQARRRVLLAAEILTRADDDAHEPGRAAEGL